MTSSIRGGLMGYPSNDDQTRQTIRQLKTIRADGARLPEEELKQRLASALEEIVGRLPRDEAANAIARLRDALIREAESRDERIVKLERELADSRRENEELKLKMNAAPAPPSAGSQGDDRGVDRIRRALILLADEGGLTDKTMSLSEKDL